MEGKRRQFERSRPYISVSNTETFVLTRRILLLLLCIIMYCTPQKIQKSAIWIHVDANSRVLIILCGWPLPLIKKKLPTDKETGLVPYFGSWWIRKWPDLEIWSMLLISLLILGYLLKKEKKIPEKDRQKGNFKNFECLR